MAKKVRNEVAVGVTVLVVLVLTIYIVVTLADWSSLFTAQQKITVRLPYTVGLKGLSVGSPIHLGGIKIGQITHTRISRLDPTERGPGDICVFFTMKIPKQYQMRRDCTLVPQSNVLGGQALLSIENLGSKGEVIADGETVDLPLADSVMDAIKREFDSDNPDSILALVKYEVNRDNADSIMASLKKTVAELEEDISAVGGQIQQTLEKAGLALDTARSTLNNLKELSGDERIDRVINNIAEVSVNLKLTSEEVRRAPWKLLYKPTQKELKIQSLVDSAGAFAVGAERLDNTAFRFQKLMATPEDKAVLDKEQIKSMVAELETSFEQFRKAEKRFWEALE
jgi:ABC-type transporter Mla subunit MlaD